MNRFDIINRIGDKYRVGNTETGEFSYAQALKTVGKDIKDYQKATTGTQHKFLDLRFENERLAVLVECKNKFSRWDKAKIQGQLQYYVRFEKAYSDKKIVAILAETDGDEVWVWFGQSVIIDDEHRMEEETVLRTFEEYEDLCFGRVNDKIKVVDSIKTLNPLILIDEYQDSYKPIIDRFVDYFIAKGIGPQFGFFGDAWQTIYQSNKACGAIEHDNIDVIKKSSNFRSAPRIVQLLNDIRPDLPQKSAIDGFDGEVVVITCGDYNGARRTDRNFKGELPPEVLKSRLDEIEAKIKKDIPNDESLKILIIIS